MLTFFVYGIDQPNSSLIKYLLTIFFYIMHTGFITLTKEVIQAKVLEVIRPFGIVHVGISQESHTTFSSDLSLTVAAVSIWKSKVYDFKGTKTLLTRTGSEMFFLLFIFSIRLNIVFEILSTKYEKLNGKLMLLKKRDVIRYHVPFSTKSSIPLKTNTKLLRMTNKM